MSLGAETLLVALVAVIAVLFAAVGNAGAVGYLAAMGLVGMAPDQMKPTALVLNVLVAAIAAVAFARTAPLPWRLIVPFAAGSIPTAYLGGGMGLRPELYQCLVGGLLLFVVARLFARPPDEGEVVARPPSPMVMVAVGAALGFLAGLSGVGGGIFLNPLLVLTRWAEPRRAAGATAAFNLVNSAAGVLGAAGSLQHVAPCLPALATAAVVGGLAGSTVGARRLDGALLRRLLALLLLLVAVRMLWIAVPSLLRAGGGA